MLTDSGNPSAPKIGLFVHIYHSKDVKIVVLDEFTPYPLPTLTSKLLLLLFIAKVISQRRIACFFDISSFLYDFNSN